jgi:hypothetical protein
MKKVSFVMSLGVNDYFMGIFRTPVLNVLSLMEPVEYGVL